MSRSFALAAALLAPGLVARLAWADTPVRLVYRAAPGCPDRDAFVALVRARNASVRLADGDAGAPRYEVSVEQDDQGTLGRLALSGQGKELLREVRAERCDEVADALALVLSLSLDASARPAVAPATPPAASPALPAPLPAPRAPDADAPRWSVGAVGSLRAGVAPGAMAGGGLLLERRSPGALWRARASFESSGTHAVEGGAPGSVRVQLWAARVEGCGWPLALSTSIALWPCAGFEGGALSARGTQIAHPGSATGVWAAAQALALLRWSASPWMAFELEGGPSVALTRHSFVFEQPERLAARPERVGVTASAGLTLTIP